MHESEEFCCHPHLQLENVACGSPDLKDALAEDRKHAQELILALREGWALKSFEVQHNVNKTHLIKGEILPEVGVSILE